MTLLKTVINDPIPFFYFSPSATQASFILRVTGQEPYGYRALVQHPKHSDWARVAQIPTPKRINVADWRVLVDLSIKAHTRDYVVISFTRSTQAIIRQEEVILGREKCRKIL